MLQAQTRCGARRRPESLHVLPAAWGRRGEWAQSLSGDRAPRKGAPSPARAATLPDHSPFSQLNVLWGWSDCTFGCSTGHSAEALNQSHHVSPVLALGPGAQGAQCRLISTGWAQTGWARARLSWVSEPGAADRAVATRATWLKEAHEEDQRSPDGSCASPDCGGTGNVRRRCEKARNYGRGCGEADWSQPQSKAFGGPPSIAEASGPALIPE